MSITLLFSLFFVYVSNAQGKFRYDYFYHKDANGWLKLHQMPATFKEAFLRCDFEGAVLASPSDDVLKETLSTIYRKLAGNNGIYIGIHATITHRDFTTIEGTPLERIPVKWAPGQPDNCDGNENCIIMLADGKLADVACNETFPYVCYKKKTKNLIFSECGTIDMAYKLDKRTGSCYKFHTAGTSWRRAQTVCLAEGGHLVIINSPIEAQVIKELFQQYPPAKMTSRVKDVVAVGFLDWGTDGLWYTVQGQKLEDIGYSTWNAGQPDNMTRNGLGSHCGGIFRNGLLDDLWCDHVNLAFICEKTPESLEFDDETSQ